jgi:hypothetical protein
MASWAMQDTKPARALKAREREILEFLLTVEIPGVEQLRLQVDHARAVPWDCGCASIDLVVDRNAAPASALDTVIETRTEKKDDPKRLLDLILWIDDGFLSSVEIADHVEPHGKVSKVFPPPSSFDPPRVRDDA